MMTTTTTISGSCRRISSSSSSSATFRWRWILCSFLFVLAFPFDKSPAHFRTSTERNNDVSMFCMANEFNTQIMARVTERLDDFLNVPVAAVNRMLNFRRIGVFKNEMTSADHDMIYWYLSMETKPRTELFVGLEDGSFFSYKDNETSYREPGNDGYNVSGIDVNDPNYKHYFSCIDDATYKQTPCIALNGTKYISCVNDCSLVPCLSSQTSTASLYTSSQSLSGTTNESEVNSTSLTVTWCADYTVEEINNETDTSALGYIPRTKRCIDRYGQPEQRPGYVVVFKNDTLNELELGNCYFADGVTMVNRTVEGPYSACGLDTNCSLPSTGAISDMAYDPRYERWYMDTKLSQQATWTGPFVNPDGLGLGVTYSQPLHNDFPPLTDDERPEKRIFQGVFGATIPLNQVNEFLTSQYSAPDIQILIVERSGPEHYLIATSNRGGDLLKMVLLSDPTQPCPINSRANLECTVARVPVSELNSTEVDDSDDANATAKADQLRIRRNNMVLYRAFIEHKDKNFPEDKLLNIKESPSIGSPAYVSQGKMYQLGRFTSSDKKHANAVVSNSSTNDPTSVQWQILVVVPMPIQQQDAALRGDPSFMIICLIASIGFVGCFVIFIQFYIKRKEKAMIHADWRFTSAFLLGCSTLNLSTFTLLGANTDQTCMLRMWSFNGLFACALSPLFVKVWRMAMLLKVEVSYHRGSLNNYRAFLYSLPLILIQIIILFIFSFVDPPRQTEDLGVGTGIGYHQITCEQKTEAFFYTQVVYDALLVSIGCILAYKTKDLDPKFGEAKQLGVSMYNVAFTGIVVVLTIRSVDLDHVTQIIIQAIGVFWGTFFCSFAFVLPRLLQVQQYRKETQSSMNDSSKETSYVQAKSGGGAGGNVNTDENGEEETQGQHTGTGGGVEEKLKPISLPPLLLSNFDFDNESEKLEDQPRVGFAAETFKSVSIPPLLLSNFEVDEDDPAAVVGVASTNTDVKTD